MKRIGTITIPANSSRNNTNTGAALLNLGSVSVNIDTVIRATSGGTGGNAITIASVGDSLDGLTLAVSGNAITIHFEDGVSTVADFEAAVAALTTSTATGLIAVDAAGSSGNVLSAPGDEFAATHLAGGAAGAFNLTQRLTGIYLRASGDGLVYVSGPDARSPSPLDCGIDEFPLVSGLAFGESIGNFSGAPVVVSAYNTTAGSLTLKVYAVAGSN